MDGVGTSIVGRSRRLSADRRARPTYTLIWEEPGWLTSNCALRESFAVMRVGLSAQRKAGPGETGTRPDAA